MTPPASPLPPPVVTVDGPSGVGKGMVSRWLAQQLGWHRLDSGALYRLLALAALRAGVSLEQPEQVAGLAPALAIEFRGSTEIDECVLLDGADVTAELRRESTGALASRIAAAAAVRAALLQRQRDFRRPPGLVADGRDMGTVVFPDAALKIFLEAAPEARALRRWRQLRDAGVDASLADLCVDVRARDERDRGRAAAPLVPATDAVVVDTTSMGAAEVLQTVGRLLRPHGLAAATSAQD